MTNWFVLVLPIIMIQMDQICWHGWHAWCWAKQEQLFENYCSSRMKNRCSNQYQILLFLIQSKKFNTLTCNIYLKTFCKVETKCICRCITPPPPINFWMDEPVFIKKLNYIISREPISMAYFINSSYQSVCLWISLYCC